MLAPCAEHMMASSVSIPSGLSAGIVRLVMMGLVPLRTIVRCKSLVDSPWRHYLIIFYLYTYLMVKYPNLKQQ